MKKIKRKFLILSSLAIILVIAACSKKFLDKPPLGTLNPQIMANEKGVQGLLIGAYSLVDGEGTSGDGFASGASNWIYGGVASDDAYKGSDPTDVGVAAPMEQWTTLDPTNGAVPQKWAACYAGAARCNDVLATMALASDITADKAALITAQVKFLRAFYHFELKKIFNNIPYADETLTPENTDNTVDAWPKIEADLTAAISALPDTWPGEPGRANVWAAKALLAKVYMYEHNYTSAYPVLQDVIANGKTAGGASYALNDHFFSNFNPAQKNSAESVFAAQTSVQDNSSVDWGGDPNGNYGDILNFPYTGGPGACCGFYNPSQSLANSFKTDAVTGLPLADPYSGPAVSAESGTAYSGTLDPRIDWTMGRPGIPYLDWGLHPGTKWIRNPTNDGNKSPIKDVYAASQKNFTDIGSAYWGPTELTANNVNIIRFADVILWAAECEVEANNLAGATTHVNQIRSRMMDHPEAWVKKGLPGDTTGNAANYNAATAIYTAGVDADKYKIGLYPTFSSQDAGRTAVRTERQLELAMEGQRFFDLVRWGIAATTINAFIGREKAARPLKATAVFVANKNEYMPIPQAEIDNLNSDGTQHLKQNQGY